MATDAVTEALNGAAVDTDPRTGTEVVAPNEEATAIAAEAVHLPAGDRLRAGRVKLTTGSQCRGATDRPPLLQAAMTTTTITAVRLRQIRTRDRLKVGTEFSNRM